MTPRGKDKNKKSNGGNLGFEEKLWQAADKMRGHMDPAEYKHIALGLIFLKYISDAFEERHSWLVEQVSEPGSEYYAGDPAERGNIAEDRDEYLSENIFWVPKDARWPHLRASAKPLSGGNTERRPPAMQISPGFNISYTIFHRTA